MVMVYWTWQNKQEIDVPKQKTTSALSCQGYIRSLGYHRIFLLCLFVEDCAGCAPWYQLTVVTMCGLYSTYTLEYRLAVTVYFCYYIRVSEMLESVTVL